MLCPRFINVLVFVETVVGDILGIGEATEAVKLAFSIARWLSGKPVVAGVVTRRDGKTPVPNVKVTIEELSTKTAQNGSFVIEGVGTGAKQIDFAFDDEVVENIAQVYVKSRGSEVSIKKPLLLPSKWGALLPTIGPKVGGCLQTTDGAPVANATLSFGNSFSCKTALSGKFIVQLQPGIHTISVEVNNLTYENVEVVHITDETTSIGSIQLVLQTATQEAEIDESSVFLEAPVEPANEVPVPLDEGVVGVVEVVIPGPIPSEDDIIAPKELIGLTEERCLEIEDLYGSWLTEVQKTRLTKSYKMLLLLSMLNRGPEAWNQPMSAEEAAPFFYDMLMSDEIRKKVDFSDAKSESLWEYDAKRMAKRVVWQPMKFWSGKSDLVAFSKGVFWIAFEIMPDDLADLHHVTKEICERRLEDYFARKAHRLNL
jgi:hypothetical protein